MSSDKFIVFGSKTCPYCRKAYNILAAKNLSFEKRDPAGIPKNVNATTIPQIFGLVNNKGIYIGGYTELEAFLKKRK